MGTFNVEIEIGDPAGARYERVMALVDTGTSFTVAPAPMLRRLGVQPLRTERFTLADGRLVERQIGQTWVRADGRAAIRIVVFGEEDAQPLLGADALEGLLLAVDPVGKRLVPVTGLLM